MQKARIKSTFFNTIIWLVLIVLTMGTLYMDVMNLSSKNTMLMILIIAMIKSQLIANYFMGLNRTKLLWRGVMFFYFVIVGGLIALAYILGMR
jgi:cytochrome c oxidase subunit IV